MYHNDSNFYPIFDGYITGTDDLTTAVKSVGATSTLPIDPTNTGDYRYYYQSTDGEDFYLEYYLETNSIKGKSQGRNYVVP